MTTPHEGLPSPPPLFFEGVFELSEVGHAEELSALLRDAPKDIDLNTPGRFN